LSESVKKAALVPLVYIVDDGAGQTWKFYTEAEAVDFIQSLGDYGDQRYDSWAAPDTTRRTERLILPAPTARPRPE
jgi:hypothetical protein